MQKPVGVKAQHESAFLSFAMTHMCSSNNGGMGTSATSSILDILNKVFCLLEVNPFLSAEGEHELLLLFAGI